MTSLRAWKLADLEAIRKVAWESWAATYGSFIPEADRRAFHDAYYSPEKLRQLFDSPFVNGSVVVNEGRVVGYSKTHWNEQRKEFFITSLYVLPEYQKLKLGKAMLDFGIEKAREYGTDRVWLGVMVENRSAIKWYLRQDFIFVENKPFTIGNTTIDDLIGYKFI